MHHCVCVCVCVCVVYSATARVCVVCHRRTHTVLHFSRHFPRRAGACACLCSLLCVLATDLLPAARASMLLTRRLQLRYHVDGIASNWSDPFTVRNTGPTNPLANRFPAFIDIGEMSRVTGSTTAGNLQSIVVKLNTPMAPWQ